VKCRHLSCCSPGQDGRPSLTDDREAAETALLTTASRLLRLEIVDLPPVAIVARPEANEQAHGRRLDEEAEERGLMPAGVKVADATGVAEVGPREVGARAVGIGRVARDSTTATLRKGLVCAELAVSLKLNGGRRRTHERSTRSVGMASAGIAAKSADTALESFILGGRLDNV